MAKKQKNRIFLRSLSIGTLLCCVGLVTWAFVVPALDRSEVADLVSEARQVLSPPIKGMTDLDEIDCDRAAHLLRQAMELAPSNGQVRREIRLAEGCSALRRGDLILAEGGLRSAAQQMPYDPRPHRWLGTLALVQERPDDARRHFRRALLCDENHIPSQVGLSDTLAELGELEDALEVIESVNTSPLALLDTRRGMILEALGRLDEARRAYQRAIELSPEIAEPRNNLSALERDQGNLELAWQLQSEAMEISPNDPVMLLNAGLLAIQRGHDQEAFSLLRRAAELDESSPDPDRALADHLLVTGRVEEALEALGPALEAFPRDAALHNTFGNTLAAAGRADEARQAYRRSIEANPNLAEPHNGLAAILLGQGDLEGAEVELDRASRLDPSNPQVQRNLLALYRRRGELEP